MGHKKYTKQRRKRRNPSTKQYAIAVGVLAVVGIIGYGLARSRRKFVIGVGTPPWLLETKDFPLNDVEGQWRWEISGNGHDGWTWRVYRGAERILDGWEPTEVGAKQAVQAVLARETRGV